MEGIDGGEDVCSVGCAAGGAVQFDLTAGGAVLFDLTAGDAVPDTALMQTRER